MACYVNIKDVHSGTAGANGEGNVCHSCGEEGVVIVIRAAVAVLIVLTVSCRIFHGEVLISYKEIVGIGRHVGYVNSIRVKICAVSGKTKCESCRAGSARSGYACDKVAGCAGNYRVAVVNVSYVSVVVENLKVVNAPELGLNVPGLCGHVIRRGVDVVRPVGENTAVDSCAESIRADSVLLVSYVHVVEIEGIYRVRAYSDLGNRNACFTGKILSLYGIIESTLAESSCEHSVYEDVLVTAGEVVYCSDMHELVGISVILEIHDVCVTPGCTCRAAANDHLRLKVLGVHGIAFINVSTCQGLEDYVVLCDHILAVICVILKVYTVKVIVDVFVCRAESTVRGLLNVNVACFCVRYNVRLTRIITTPTCRCGGVK